MALAAKVSICQNKIVDQNDENSFENEDENEDGNEIENDSCLRWVALAAKITARHSCSGANKPRGEDIQSKDGSDRNTQEIQPMWREHFDGIKQRNTLWRGHSRRIRFML